MTKQLFLPRGINKLFDSCNRITHPCTDVDLLNVRDESAEGDRDRSILLAPM